MKPPYLEAAEAWRFLGRAPGHAARESAARAATRLDKRTEMVLMTTTPQEPADDPDVVPSGDTDITPDPDADPEEVPGEPPPE